MAKKKGLIDRVLHGKEEEVKPLPAHSEKEEARLEPLAGHVERDGKKYSDHPKFAKFKGEKV